MSHFLDVLRPNTLQKKILLLVFSIFVVVSIIFGSIVQMILLKSEELLYKQVLSNMSYSSQAIENCFSIIENSFESLSFNRELQHSLQTAYTNPEYTNKWEAIRQMDSSVSIYYDQLAPYHLSYIILKTPYAQSSNYSTAPKLTDEMIEDFESLAKQNSGQPLWITDYSQTYGIFLVRDIRYFSEQGFNSLGTLIFCIDIDSIISDSISSSVEFSETYYALREGDSLLSANISNNHPKDIQSLSGQPYAIVEINDSSYFQSDFKLPSLGWDFSLFVPFDSIYTPIHTLKISVVILIIATMFIATVTSEMILRTFLNGLQTLVKKMENFGKSVKNEPVYTVPSDEISYLHIQFDEMASNISTLIKDNYELELLRKDADIKQLRAQINPHFLFNTLDSINWRAKASGDEVITQIVESLAVLLRNALEEKKQITLQKELHLVKNYLTIQNIRYSENLKYTIEVPDNCLPLLIPPMILQPLIENAIRYSLEQQGELCFIHISAQITDVLKIVVKNTSSEFEDGLLEKLATKSASPHGFGVGLLNIHQRIQLMYGNQYGLQLSNDDEFAIVTITLPIVKEGESIDVQINDC